MVFPDVSGNALWTQSSQALGSGAFATVYLGMSEAGRVLAMKNIHLDKGRCVVVSSPFAGIGIYQCIASGRIRFTEDQLDKLLQELKLLITCRHNNIVSYYGVGLLPVTQVCRCPHFLIKVAKPEWGPCQPYLVSQHALKYQKKKVS